MRRAAPRRRAKCRWVRYSCKEMCASAIVHARVARVVFGAWDPKAGAAGSTVNVFTLPSMNHRVDVFGGVLMEESARLLNGFFEARRREPT